MGISNREEIIERMKQANQPDTQKQQLQQMEIEMKLQNAKATIENIQADTAETMSRVQQNQVETQLLPIEEETKRIAALAKTMPMDEFEQLIETAKLELKNKEIESKANLVALQMSDQTS